MSNQELAALIASFLSSHIISSISSDFKSNFKSFEFTLTKYVNETNEIPSSEKIF
ncbi:MAG: hypothetical protein VX613_05930 [Candidatus Thermoplasmatota archaeon]|nr:hypothetical protein [Candidatus Thermoplasmatota archaeon]